MLNVGGGRDRELRGSETGRQEKRQTHREIWTERMAGGYLHRRETRRREGRGLRNAQEEKESEKH